MKFYFNENIASNLYEYSCDFDCMDYLESKEKEIKLLNQAIEKIYSYSGYNEDMKVLYNALYMAFSE